MLIHSFTQSRLIKYSVALLILGMSQSVIATETGNAQAGKAKAAVCAACHSADGNSVNPSWPKLAGQHPKYIIKQLLDFKAGQTRKDPLMAGMVANLSKTDMLDLAAYYSSQKVSAAKAKDKLVAVGRKLYLGGNLASGVAACMSCHLATGRGNPLANFPSLAGQHSAYLVKALNDFKTSKRTNDAGKMMQNIANKMTDDEINAVSSYIQGLY